MSTTTQTSYITMGQAVQRLGPDQKPLRTFAELLNKMNQITTDAAFEMANDSWSHMENVRSVLPTVSPRTLNTGATRSHSSVRRYREQMCLLEVWCEIDARIAEAEGDIETFLAGEYSVYGEAMMQELCRLIVYGNPGTDSREIKGWANRYNLTSMVNVVGLSGTGSDTSSLFMVEWGPMVNKIIYPRAHPGFGMSYEPRGKQRITDGSNNPLDAYVMKAAAELGISIPDEDRAVQRLANIETASWGTNDLLVSAKTRELHAARNRLWHGGDNAVIYVNRDIKTQMDILAQEASNGFHTYQELQNLRPVTAWGGIPVRMLEAIVSTETAIS